MYPKKVRRREDESYDHTPLDPEYTKTYYAKKLGVKEKCKLCGREVAHMHMERHFATQVCQTANRLKELETKRLAVRGIDIFEGKQMVAIN